MTLTLFDLTAEERLARQREQQREWRELHPARVKALQLKHAARPEIKARKRQWAAENREAVNARRRERDRLKRQQSRQEAQREARQLGCQNAAAGALEA